MADSDSSTLSSAPSSDEETEQLLKPSGIARYFKPTSKPNYEPKVVIPQASPPPPKREPSPPHEYILIDNDAIAVIVMFRSRFNEAFSRSCPHFGPQELETGVRDIVPTEQAERLLCALLALCLNRKKDPEREHYGRALEEAVATHSNQWPKAWEGKNPLHGGGSFKTMSPEQRLILLRALVYWSLSSSHAVQAILKESYKQARQESDLNQPLSVQPWGRDGYKRKFWLIEGQDDTHFELYRENSGSSAKTNIWFGVAGTIDELKGVAHKLDEEGTPHARTLRDRIQNSIPRFESGEEKRKRRDYRLARKAAFARPEPGFSLYEGRTRGKKIRYTFSDDDEDFSDAVGLRRSTRQSGVSTPAEAGPVVTSSGRQVKPRHAGIYGESILTDQRKELEAANAAQQMDVDQINGDEEPATTVSGRPQRSKPVPSGGTNGLRGGRTKDDGYNSIDDMDDESDAVSDEHDWEAEDEDEDEPDLGDDESEDNDDAESEEDEEDKASRAIGGGLPDSLVVQLRYRGGEELPPKQGVQVVVDNSSGQQPAANGVKREVHVPPSDTIELVNGHRAYVNGQGAVTSIPGQKPAAPTVAEPTQPQELKPEMVPVQHHQSTIPVATESKQEAPPESPSTAHPPQTNGNPAPPSITA